MITTIILTFNEEKHIERSINSALSISDQIIVVDSFSTDSTQYLAKKAGVEFYQNPFVHNAQQFQWALENCIINNEWVMKLDADEYLTDELINEIKYVLTNPTKGINGYKVKCRVHFLGKWIKRGFYPMILNRIFRKSEGFMEQKWMDEHIQLKSGSWQLLNNDIVDENLNNLSWWTQKHNNYATREAIVRLNNQYNFLNQVYISKTNKQFYLRLPLFLRSFLYFFYRYVIKLGFLEGKEGLMWHLLQGFWFQILVDSKIYQIKYMAQKNDKSIKQTIEEYFEIKLK